jgi:outer membrane receptor protein involved in Fe transport
MRNTLKCASLALALLFIAGSAAWAQQTTGTITGRIVDEQDAALPGATVTARHPETGFSRTVVTDGEGLYRLAALPVGVYDLTIEMSGFATLDRKGIVLNVGQTLDVNLQLKVATIEETVTVTGESPLIEATSSSVGGVVDVARIENLPLNGRQFANLAATIPGVGLGFHSDPTKSTQFSPQINGGNGRNVNYQIDGGDNNDDTVGGLLQLFPLEAIQEFNFVTSRSKAEYGRSQGGVMNIVTKSGTNDLHGSWFTLFRHDAMNAWTETERIAHAEDPEVEKQDYRRYQYGGSFGGPIRLDKVHYFLAVERTQQDTKQAVSTKGLFPRLDGVFETPYRETLVTGKVTAALSPAHYLSVRYGRNENSQPYGVDPSTPPNGWGDSTNTFNSVNLNHNWVIRGTMVNEFIFQFADFQNFITANSTDPSETFPNGVYIGQSVNTPQSTQQKKWQFRDDFSWHVTGLGGVGHDFKTGVNFINEPRLYVTFEAGKGVMQYTHMTNDPDGPLSYVSMDDGIARANIPMKQYAAYFQDDWRLTDNLTVNLGLRYDYLTGYQYDQSNNPNYVKIQEAGRAGLLQGIKGLENAGLEPEEDKNNFQPRIGMAWDVRGDGKDVVRAGWGIYMDMAYTNSNGLFAAFDAQGAFGTVLEVQDNDGIRNPDGSFYRIGQPVANIASQNQADPTSLPLYGQWVDPRLQMPYTRQTALGWSHQLTPSTMFSIDFVRADGRNLNTRSVINVYMPGTTTRRLAFLGLQPNSVNTRPAISQAKSEYTAGLFGIKRRMSNGLDLTATYTLAKAKSHLGNGSDELNVNVLQDSYLLFDDPRTFGPAGRTDARHQGTVAAVLQVKGFTFSPIFLFRSPLPVAIYEGVDLNRNSVNNDLPAMAYRFDGYDPDANGGLGAAKVVEDGPCETWNCGRGAWRRQMNLRVSYGFRLYKNTRLEAIGEVFNLFNAKNPSAFITRRLLGTGEPNPEFMQPQEFAGDFQNPEQRVGQVGFRFSF